MVFGALPPFSIEVVGLREEEAKLKLEEFGYKLRVIKRDGTDLMITFGPTDAHRLNVEVNSGIITKFLHMG